jgi:FAD/FMN-containing dehydrogenase
VAEAGRSPRIGELVQALVNAPITPSTIEIVGPPMRLLIRLETTATAAERMAQAASAICARHGAPAEMVSGEGEQALWARAEAGVWNEPGTVVKISVLPTDVPYLLGEIEAGCAAQGVQWSLTGRAALGVLFLRVHGNAPAIRPLLADWRHRASVGGGSLVLHSSAPDVEQFDRWGDSGDAMPVMRAVKARFDPHHILSPGMGPGRL